MELNRFSGNFSVDKAKDKLELSHEGPDILSETIDRVTILFHGEVKKYLDVIPAQAAGSVSESILWLYKTHGDSFAKQIDGHFVIVLYDQPSDKLLIIQDKYTFYEKLYWILNEGTLIFSNNIKELTKKARIDPGEINTSAIYHLLLYSYTPPPHTIYKDVRQLEIGEMMLISNGEFRNYKYDEWSFSENRIRDKKEALPLYKDVLTKSIGRLLEKNPSSVFLLSGGFDSSLNVALGSQISSDPLTTVGIGTDDRFNTDAPYAKKVSKMFNTRHKEYIFEGHEIEDLPKIVHALGVPYFEPGMMLSYAALREAGKHSRFAIGGEATDQLFGCCAGPAYQRYSVRKNTLGLFTPAYRFSKGLSRSRLFEGNATVRKIEGRLIGKYDVNTWYGAFGFNRSGILKEMLKENFHFPDRWDDLHAPDRDLSRLYDFCCLKLNLEYSFYGILSVYAPLFELHNITSHSSYVDRDVINFVLSLDHDLREPRINSPEKVTEEKYLHKELAREIFPPEITNRGKQGGAIDSSIHLLDEDFVNAIKRKLINSEILNRFFKSSLIEKMFVPPHYDPVRIFLLVSLDLWYYLFVANPSEDPPAFTLSEYLEVKS